VPYRIARSVFVLVLLGALPAAARDIAVVVNKYTPAGSMTVAELVKVCKAETSRWPDGKPVTFIMRAPSAPEMTVVVQKIYGLSESDVSDLIVNANHGRTNHPAILIVNSDEDLVNKVASNPGAVGVVDVYSINSSVGVIKIAGKLPLEPGYLLHGN